VIGSPASHARRLLLETDDLTVEDHACRDHDPDWTVCSPVSGHALVLVRRGAFRRRVRGAEALLDPGVAFFTQPGMEEEVAHPIEGGDDDTIVTLSERLVAELRGGQTDLPVGVVFTTPEDHLRHRLVLAACGRGEGSSAGDATLALAAAVLRRSDPARADAGRPSTSSARRRIVDEVREALAERPHLGLLELARLVSVSPYHLSRVFSSITGQTLSTYRRRLRIGSALERLREGDEDLASVGADAGFADHAHLTRTFRRELGDVPSRIRHLIGPSPRWS
jgi:AraC-like DNA-binding protein